MELSQWTAIDNTLKTRPVVSPSILAGDFGSLADSARRVEDAGADLIHVDVMDGHFVPNITFGPDVVYALKKAVNIPLDVHLMISRPDIYAKKFVEAGADLVTVHQEAEHDMSSTLAEIRKMGAMPGAVVNPNTEISSIADILGQCRMVLVMSVYPGFGGQKFMHEVLHKISELKELREKNGYDFWIEIDGGINAKTGKLAFQKGVDVLVAGTYIFGKADMSSAVKSLKFTR